MKRSLMAVVLAAGAFGSAAHAADLTVSTRERPVVLREQPSRVIARLATQGLGYSVLHEPIGVSPRPFRVHVTCTIDESFMQTYCPTPEYDSYCPRATIICR